MTPSARTRIKTTFGLGTLTALMAVMLVNVGAQRSAPSGYISGTVRSTNGPEGGVWVIAETKDLPTNFIKIVVTDDSGRFMLPELPDANYRVWVRGYGLVDSTPVQSKPGATALALNATLAKTPVEAAKVYPADYWLSMLEPPAKSEFPGTGRQGQRHRPAMLTQNHYINSLKSDCNFCHQLGNAETRDVEHSPEGEAGAEDARGGVGVAAGDGRARHVDVRRAQHAGQGSAAQDLRRWTERIAKGEVPPAPPRPKGVERNLVVTLWDVGDDHSFMHDEVTTDKNRPPSTRTARLRGVGRPRSAGRARHERQQDRVARHPDARGRRRRCRRASRRRTGRRSTGATSTCGPTRPTTRPIRTTRCSTARGACG
jgi:hypothetical protein